MVDSEVISAIKKMYITFSIINSIVDDNNVRCKLENEMNIIKDFLLYFRNNTPNVKGYSTQIYYCKLNIDVYKNILKDIIKY